MGATHKKFKLKLCTCTPCFFFHLLSIWSEVEFLSFHGMVFFMQHCFDFSQFCTGDERMVEFKGMFYVCLHSHPILIYIGRKKTFCLSPLVAGFVVTLTSGCAQQLHHSVQDVDRECGRRSSSNRLNVFSTGGFNYLLVFTHAN